MELLKTAAQIAGSVTGIVAALVLLIKPLREWVLGTKAIRDGQKCLLRHNMLHIYYKHHDEKQIRQYEYEVRTVMKMGNECYIPTAVMGSTLAFKIPAELSVGKRQGRSETRIFVNDDVVSVIEIRYDIVPAVKPDIVPVELTV